MTRNIDSVNGVLDQSLNGNGISIRNGKESLATKPRIDEYDVDFS
jgi:hypothetical protein